MKLFLINLFSQMLFIYLRTVNISSVAKDNLYHSVVSGVVLSFLYIYTTTLGVNAFNNKDVLSVVGYLVGGVIGLVLAMRFKQIFHSVSKTIFSTKNHE